MIFFFNFRKMGFFLGNPVTWPIHIYYVDLKRKIFTIHATRGIIACPGEGEGARREWKGASTTIGRGACTVVLEGGGQSSEKRCLSLCRTDLLGRGKRNEK